MSCSRTRPSGRCRPSPARCATARSGAAALSIRVQGRSGQASMRGTADNALVKAAPLIGRLAALRPEPQVQQEVAAFLAAVLGEVPAPERILERANAVDPLAAELVEPL